MTDTPNPSVCAHPELRLAATGLFCNECGVQIDEESPIPVDRNDNLRTVHEIDNAHASAERRLEALMTLLDQWQKISINQSARDATENPMVFYAFVQIFRTRVAADELPYLMAAMILRLAAGRVQP
jgi:hypothetical protein